MSGDRDDHSHGHSHHPSPMTDGERRVQVLEELLVERGLVKPEELDQIVETYVKDVGPMKGAKVVARAWTDEAFKARLLAGGTAAIEELELGGPTGFLIRRSDATARRDIVVVENTPEVHNVVVCTLCSCYPWSVLGLPPTWYKSPPYRARMVREPRTLLAEMGCDVPPEVEIAVWDSSAEQRYMVLPERPADTDGATEAELAAMVTRDSMIGVARL